MHCLSICPRLCRRALSQLSPIAAAVVGLALVPLLANASTAKHAPPAVPCPVSASAPAPSTPATPFALSASTQVTGCVDLQVTGAAAASVSISEVSTGSPGRPIATVPTQGGEATLEHGVPWVCTATTRTFQATETLADGTQQTTSTTVATPSCADRITVNIPPNRLHRGYPVTLAIRDRWYLGGLRVQACQPAVRLRDCSAIELRPGHVANLLRLRLRSAGHVVLSISDGYQTLHRAVAVSSSRPLLLATGDSEMQVLDELLASDLSGSGGARVVGDAHQSTAISSPFFFNWPAHAVGQVEGLHPDIVAMFLGGNDGFELSGVECCGASWSRQYAARVAGMMRLYLQHGAAAVYWFLIPTPSREPFVRVVRAVDQGVELAAHEFREGVHVFDLRPVFSPGGRYIDSLDYDGRSITVHEPDGFHLSESADVIVARMFIARLRRDGLLP
jgi:lysophospholipase L1-like esterase